MFASPNGLAVLIPGNPGLRFFYNWRTQRYRLRVQRAEGDASGDWFDLAIAEGATGAYTFVGGVKIPRANPAVAGTLSATGTSSYWVYDPDNYAAVPLWQLATRATADGRRAQRASAVYPSPGFANSTVAYDAPWDRVFVGFGGNTARCDAGELFSR